MRTHNKPNKLYNVAADELLNTEYCTESPFFCAVIVLCGFESYTAVGYFLEQSINLLTVKKLISAEKIYLRQTNCSTFALNSVIEV